MSLSMPEPKPSSPERQALAGAALFLAFQPSPEVMQRVIRSLMDLCQLTLADSALVYRVRLAVSELVENAVKYGIQPNVRVEVELLERAGATIFRLSTLNRATPEHLECAVELLTELKNAADPVAFYDQLVLESAPKRGVSGLGLARIRAEGLIDVEFAVEAGALRIWVELAVDGETA
jgi:hypothetical protein